MLMYENISLCCLNIWNVKWIQVSFWTMRCLFVVFVGAVCFLFILECVSCILKRFLLIVVKLLGLLTFNANLNLTRHYCNIKSLNFHSSLKRFSTISRLHEIGYTSSVLSIDSLKCLQVRQLLTALTAHWQLLKLIKVHCQRLVCFRRALAV